MTLEEITNNELLKHKEILEASENLANELREKFNDLGYHLSYGYRFDTKRNRVISIDAKYNSEFKIPYDKNSLKKLQEITPKSYIYEGKNIPVQFGEIVKTNLLLNNFWIYLQKLFS